MSKFLIVFKREYAQVVKKKSFVIGLVLTPVLLGMMVVAPALLATLKASDTEHLAVIDQTGRNIGDNFAVALDTYKLEDDKNTPYYAVERVFNLDPADTARVATLEDSLGALINDKSLKYVLVLKHDADLIDSNVYLISNADNRTTLRRFERELSNLLASVRLKRSNIDLPLDSTRHLTRSLDLSVRDTKGESMPFITKYFSALIFVMILFGTILGYGQIVMRSVIEEKNSRIMEVMISSVTPFQLMMGKILGLGAATLTQIAAWFGMGAGLFFMRASLDIGSDISRIVFDPAIVIFFMLFLVFGYLLYSTLFALLGSIVTAEKEAQSMVAPITLVLIVPMIVGISIVQEPNSTLARVLSLIPFTAPTMMMMRLVFVAPTVTEYSLFSGIVGEALLAFLLILATFAGMVWLTAKVFRIGILMYGKRPTLPEILKWVKY